MAVFDVFNSKGEQLYENTGRRAVREMNSPGNTHDLTFVISGIDNDVVSNYYH